MKPALTPEEWAHREKWGAIAVGSASDPRPHALAALALHGQPFGFTREDVEWLREMVDSDTNPETAPVEFNAMCLSLAARIEALLPPEAK